MGSSAEQCGSASAKSNAPTTAPTLLNATSPDRLSLIECNLTILRSGKVYRRPLNVQIVVRLGGYSGAAALGQQIAAQEGLQVAVQHLVHVADFDLGAMVLGHAVGL